MKLTMWRVVVVLNMYTKFREKQSPSPFLQGDYFSRNLFTKKKTTATCPIGKFHPVSLVYLCFNQMATIL